ncbi:MAG TPA: OmpA family protein [Kofleriaceae bacterium]|nr:OmpA family protein [Kofleriaceae bacterium]
MPALKLPAGLGLVTAAIALAVGAAPRTAAADPSSGIDSALFRSSYDTGGVFAVEGARLMPKRDISFKLNLSYGHAPLTLAVPGIGGAAGDTGEDRVLKYLVTLDLTFGMTLTDRIAFGMDVAAYRTATGDGYGVRGRYGMGGQILRPSTGLISLRPLSNIDQSASPSDSGAYLGDGLAGPLDARFGLKVSLIQRPLFAVTAIGSVFLPFGDDQMLLGDANLVFEPKLAVDWRKDRIHATRLVGNLAARIRERTVLEGYDTRTAAATPADAKAFLDVGSELVLGVGGIYELSPRLVAGLEVQAFIPLPDGLSWGDCFRYSGAPCSSLTSADYFSGAGHGDFTTLVTAGLTGRLSGDVTANVMLGTSAGGARGEDFRVTTGIVWAPQPGGGLSPSRNDRDGDGIPDSVDACPDEPEDKDGFQDEDGCPDPDNDGDGIPDVDDKCPNEPEDKDGFQDADGCPDLDNDGDGIPDAIDKCPNEPEDKDGFEDEDGCPDDDNDGDGIPDAIDKCPNDPETVNGFEDADGCPDVRGTSGPEERADRLDLKGVPVTFGRGALSPPARQLLNQVATLIKTHRLTIRVEVHVALGTRSGNPGAIAAQKRKDKQTAQQRAKLIADYLIGQGVSPQQLQAVGLGSDRPLGAASPTDPVNERVDFIKSQQGGAP